MLEVIVGALISGILGFAAKFLTDWIAASKNEKVAAERAAAEVRQKLTEDAAKADKTYADIAMDKPTRADVADRLRKGTF